MKAFLSYNFKDDISLITNYLLENGVEIFDPSHDMDYGSSFQKTMKNAILDCDFVVLIYTGKNPNIAFEAGIAVSRNKPIFAVISTESPDDPDFLFDSTYVNALPTEIDKIKFNFNIFLDKIKPRKKNKIVKKNKFYGGGLPNFYIDIYNKYNNTKTEREYEKLFKEIFEKYQLEVIQNKFDSNSKFYTDFCIWSDKLSNILGNPILIEIKREINYDNFDSIVKNVENLVNNNSAQSCLIFYDKLNLIEPKQLPYSSKYLFINISNFIEKLNHNDFNESIRELRNEIVHNKF